MSRPLVSVVLATYQRKHLLERSLLCYQLQDFPAADFELVVVDDHSTDGTCELVLDWSLSTGIRATVLTAAPKGSAWRDCGAVLNYGIRAAAGEYILLTHPEVMPGRKSVAACVEVLSEFEKQRRKGPIDWDAPPVHDPELGPLPRAAPALPFGLYACCRPYYLTRQDQLSIDRVDWIREGPLAVRKIPAFYDDRQHLMGNPDYTPRCIEQIGTPGFRLQTWESWVFGGCSRQTWKNLGGMLETQMWGSVDVGFVHRRKALGIPNHTCGGDDTICIHQNHDNPDHNVPTPRVEEAWRQELAGMVNGKRPEELAYPAINHLGWS